MGGFGHSGPLGSETNHPTIDAGTHALTATPTPGSGASTTAAGRVAIGTDPAIEALALSSRARKAAYALKKAHPSVIFTSGRRGAAAQAFAMAGNVAKKRKWIVLTYAPCTLSAKCQAWVDKHPEATTKAEIAAGLTTILGAALDSDLRLLSRHLSGDAFDVQPVSENATKIKQTIRHLPGLRKFLDKEGGLVRWHVEF